MRLQEQTLDPRTLVSISIACFFIGYSIWNAHGRRQRLDRGATRVVKNFIFFFFQIFSLICHLLTLDLKTLKSSIMMFLVLMSLSPVLRTLSAATSSDSIWALAALLFILNALLADYTANVSEDEINEGYVFMAISNIYIFQSFIYFCDRLSSVLSMNAAVSASVVLASRLSTNVSVFALVLFSILSFALFPILRRRLQVRERKKKKGASFFH